MSNHLFTTRCRCAHAQRGFSFLEIMLVVVIIGVLAGIVGPRMFGKTKTAKIAAARAQMTNIKTALTQYDMMAGEVPSTDQGLIALVERPSDVEEADWEQVFESLPKDPWGEDYLYESPGENDRPFDLSSKGPDRRDGTDDDILLFKEAE